MTQTGPNPIIPRTPAEWRDWGVDTEPLLQHPDRTPKHAAGTPHPGLVIIERRRSPLLADWAPAVTAALWIVLVFDIVVAALGLYALAPFVLVVTAQSVGAFTFMKVQAAVARLIAQQHARAGRR